jgi:hypothetical protein
LAPWQSASHTSQGLNLDAPLANTQVTAAAMGESPSVTAYDKEYFYYDENHNYRTITKTVTFPDAGKWYEKVTMHLNLDCPDGKCDKWDRSGYVAVRPDNKNIEVMRFMTPYGIKGSWDLDVTSLQALLKGNVPMEIFIDTWVKAGHKDGNGWLVTVSFDFEKSTSSNQPVTLAVIPLWNEQKLIVGNEKPLNISPISVKIPENAGSVELRSLITGHGQGNTENCAEFCKKTHSYTVGEKIYSSEVWREDCWSNPLQPQHGTWVYSRAGWCPGDIVKPWFIDVTKVAKPNTTVKVNYQIESYINQKREGYDKGEHTEPFYRTSAVLIVYANNHNNANSKEHKVENPIAISGRLDSDPNKAILPAQMQVYFKEGSSVVNTSTPGFEERILPTVNEFIGNPGCYVTAYSRNAKNSVYPVGDGIYVMGQVRFPGSYEGRICKPANYDSRDISAETQFKDLFAQKFPLACQDQKCWAGGDTGGWFGIPQ